MKAVRKKIVIEDPDKVVLSGLPFKRGQQVEILCLAEEKSDIQTRVKEAKALFQKTQTLPKVQSLTDAEIAEEIKKYRAGK